MVSVVDWMARIATSSDINILCLPCSWLACVNPFQVHNDHMSEIVWKYSSYFPLLYFCTFIFYAIKTIFLGQMAKTLSQQLSFLLMMYRNWNKQKIIFLHLSFSLYPALPLFPSLLCLTEETMALGKHE
jgi:hypothetical protein